MIIEIPDDNSIVKWRYKDNEDWKSAEISDLIKAYERPQGEWITDDNRNVVCSYCGGIRRDCRIDHIEFCNRCGAEMKGGAE